MDTHDFADMYFRSPWALGVHIRQIPRELTTVTCVIGRLFVLCLVDIKLPIGQDFLMQSM